MQMRRRKEKERRKTFFCEGEEEWRGKKKRIFGEGNYLGARILDLGGGGRPAPKIFPLFLNSWIEGFAQWAIIKDLAIF